MRSSAVCDGQELLAQRFARKNLDQGWSNGAEPVSGDVPKASAKRRFCASVARRGQEPEQPRIEKRLPRIVLQFVRW
jgi:hypothetical protein